MDFIKSLDKCYFITKEYFHIRRLVMHFFLRSSKLFLIFTVESLHYFPLLWFNANIYSQNFQVHESYIFKEERSMWVNPLSIDVVISDKIVEEKMISMISLQITKYFCCSNFCIAVLYSGDNWHIVDNIR